LITPKKRKEKGYKLESTEEQENKRPKSNTYTTPDLAGPR
jgi:hypothetical protein